MKRFFIAAVVALATMATSSSKVSTKTSDGYHFYDTTDFVCDEVTHINSSGSYEWICITNEKAAKQAQEQLQQDGLATTKRGFDKLGRAIERAQELLRLEKKILEKKKK